MSSDQIKLVEIGRVLLNSDFVNETQKIKGFLNKCKGKFDRFDEIAHPLNEQIEFIEKEKTPIFRFLDEHFETIWEYTKKLSDIEHRHHQKYCQNELHPFLLTKPLNERIYEKPLGYPGDFIMMNYYYDDGYEGDSTYDKLIHRYTLSIPIARAVINRPKFIEAEIERIANSSTEKFSVASLASGPAKEIIRFIERFPFAKGIYTCIDSEKDALEFVKGEVRQVEASKKASFEFNYYDYNLLNIIKKIMRGGVFPPQNFVYASGLFDYLEDKIAVKLTRAMFKMLVDGGQLVIANIHKNSPSRAYLELLGEWYLKLRDEKDMQMLAEGIVGADIVLEKDKENGRMLYLIVKKRHK